MTGSPMNAATLSGPSRPISSASASTESYATRDALAELFGRLVSVEPKGRVGGQLSHLVCGSIGYLLPPVADVAVPEAGGGVQVAPTVPVENLTPLAANDYHLVRAGHVCHVGESMPEARLLSIRPPVPLAQMLPRLAQCSHPAIPLLRFSTKGLSYVPCRYPTESISCSKRKLCWRLISAANKEIRHSLSCGAASKVDKSRWMRPSLSVLPENTRSFGLPLSGRFWGR